MRYKYPLLWVFIAFSLNVLGQDCSNVGGNTWDYFTADSYTGNFEDAGTWCDGRQPNTNGAVDRVLYVYGTVTRNGNINPVDTRVYGNLIVTGNYQGGNSNGLTIESGGILEVYGDFTALHSVNVKSGGILIVHGNVSITNSGGTISGDMIVLGDITITNGIVNNTGNLIVGGDFTFPGGGFNSPVGDENVYILDPAATITTAPYGSINNGDYGDAEAFLQNESEALKNLVSSLYGPLPVELIFFQAINEDEKIHLEWATASELNNDYFVLERSSNGKDFYRIASIPGNGTSHTRLTYTYQDYTPLVGISYYRLTQVDFDGTIEIFDIISVNRENKLNIPATLKVFPNPYKNGDLIFSLPDNFVNKPVQVKLIASYGAVLLNETKNQQMGLLKLMESSLESFSDGFYIVNISNGTEVLSQKLLFGVGVD